MGKIDNDKIAIPYVTTKQLESAIFNVLLYVTPLRNQLIEIERKHQKNDPEPNITIPKEQAKKLYDVFSKRPDDLRFLDINLLFKKFARLTMVMSALKEINDEKNIILMIDNETFSNVYEYIFLGLLCHKESKTPLLFFPEDYTSDTRVN